MWKPQILEDKIIERATPLDFTFKKLTSLESGAAKELVPRPNAIGKVPPHGKHGKYLTRSILLNNNNLIKIKNIEPFVNSVLEYPEKIKWLDLSSNYLTELDECICILSNLRILYLHGNKLDDVNEVCKLRGLINLRSLTLYGNPMADCLRYYKIGVVAYLPQLTKLDLCAITNSERNQLKPAEIVKRLVIVENLENKEL